MTISLCMIVKNEEETLARCLDSVKGIVDEINILDTGSTDRTCEIAAKYTKRVKNFTWIDDFAAARNASFDMATMDYILWLDADDVLMPEDAKALKKLKKTLSPDVDAVMMKYNIGFDAQGNVTFSFYRERLLRRAAGFRWQEPVHEHVAIGGNIINSDIAVTHRKMRTGGGDRNLKIYEKNLKNNGDLSPRGKYYYARELRDNARYEDAAHWFEAFLTEGKGWVEDNINACILLAFCFDRLEKPEQSLRALLRSFEYDAPRAQACCKLGYYYKNKADFKRALFWFDLALERKTPSDSWSFVERDYEGYIPLIEGSVCHWRLGNLDKAMDYNRRAGEHKPGNASVLHNQTYFESLMHRGEAEKT